MDNTVFLLKAISDIITAGGAIVAFSLFIYVITFQIKDRVTRSFTFLLACIVLILGTDAFFTTTENLSDLEFLLRFQYAGLIFLPTVYFFFSDALLAITGKPSRGKRTILGIVSLGISLLFIYLNSSGKLFSEVQISNPPVPYIRKTMYFDFFSVFFVTMMVAVWYNFVRALNRTVTKKSKRRMLYLVVSAIGPALGSFPYLLYGSQIITRYPSLFWLISIAAYTFISVSIVVMTYTVSFFGLPWPDRVVKSRLFKWIMRGPVTAILTLGVTTLITRIGVQIGTDLSSITILGMVATIVTFEFFVTIFSPYWERFLFSRNDKKELEQIRQLENRFLTRNDLQQFLELILVTFCDQLQTRNAVFLENGSGNVPLIISKGKTPKLDHTAKSEIINYLLEKQSQDLIISYKEFSVFPITQKVEEEINILGCIATNEKIDFELGTEKETAIRKLLERSASALIDRNRQDQLIHSLDVLTPQVSAIQNLLASSRFNQSRIINGNDISNSEDFEKHIKDALGHFFGGPKLARSPLIYLSVTQKKIVDENDTSIAALRSVLKEAISRLRPEGERQYTNEWVLFNILDQKFLEGWKVKDICMRLSLSEADFYRKQRVAISAVADQIILMEQESNK